MSACSLSKPAQKPAHRIIILVNYALFKRNDRIVGNVNILGTDFRAAFGDVAVTDAQFVLQQLSPIQAIERVHLQTGNANEEARAGELFRLLVIAQHVTDVLAEETFNALAKLLH